jgi:hypothetical protein
MSDDGECKRKYSDEKFTTHTSFDEKGYPVYKRPDREDQRVVPHNREILVDWEGHANLEFAASTYCIFYLYSYLFKGNRKVQITLNNAAGIDSNDEINIFLRGRMLTSMDAMWRVFGFQTYPAPFPSVRLIKAKHPTEVVSWCNEGKLTDIYVYFQRPASLQNLKICEFFTLYDYKYNLNDARFRDNTNNFEEDGSLRYCLINGCGNIRQFYIYKRLHPDHSITRLNGVPPDAGEIFYIRYMLRELAFSSFNDMLTVNGVLYTTFQEATYQRGLLNNDSEAFEAFVEARLYQGPSGLRALFVLLTIQGFPTLRIYDDMELRQALYIDFLRGNTPASVAAATQKLLEDLHERFSRSSKDMSIYGLPKPLILRSELERELELIGCQDSNARWLQDLHNETPNTDEMNEAYQQITQAIEKGETAFFAIIGVGGAGKTQFAKKVTLYQIYNDTLKLLQISNDVRFSPSQDH